MHNASTVIDTHAQGTRGTQDPLLDKPRCTCSRECHYSAKTYWKKCLLEHYAQEDKKPEAHHSLQQYKEHKAHGEKQYAGRKVTSILVAASRLKQNKTWGQGKM